MWQVKQGAENLHFIVMDLEWNQPTSYQSPVFRKIGDSLLFEVIQIGAAKLDERFEIVDSVDIHVRPTHYLTIHPRVRRMTRLGQEELCDAPVFLEAMDQFTDWCGENCVFLTWGGDDVSVLQQNIDFFRFERPVPKTFDVQRYFAKVFGLGVSQRALKSAMEQLEIEKLRNIIFTTPCTTHTIRRGFFKSCRTPWVYCSLSSIRAS